MATMRTMFDLLTDSVVEKKRILTPENQAFVECLLDSYLNNKTITFEQTTRLEHIYDTHKNDIWSAKQ